VLQTFGQLTACECYAQQAGLIVRGLNAYRSGKINVGNDPLSGEVAVRIGDEQPGNSWAARAEPEERNASISSRHLRVVALTYENSIGADVDAGLDSLIVVRNCDDAGAEPDRGQRHESENGKCLKTAKAHNNLKP
jgi:hypothetical protein